MMQVVAGSSGGSGRLACFGSSAASAVHDAGGGGDLPSPATTASPEEKARLRQQVVAAHTIPYGRFHTPPYGWRREGSPAAMERTQAPAPGQRGVATWTATDLRWSGVSSGSGERAARHQMARRCVLATYALRPRPTERFDRLRLTVAPGVVLS